MEEIMKKSLQAVKAHLNGIQWRGDIDEYEYGWKSPDIPPPPPEDELEYKRWDHFFNRSRRPKDFNERWNFTQSAFEKIRASESVSFILSELNALQFYLERKAEEPITISEFRQMPDGQMSLYQIARDTRVDSFFEDRVLIKVRKSISDLKELKELSAYSVEEIEKPKNQLPNSNLLGGFAAYISERCQNILMPYLLEIYKGQRPESFGYLLYALVDIDLIRPSVLTSNLSKLHRDMAATFGNVGSRENLRKTIERLARANATEEIEIKKHINHIRSFLKLD